MSALLHIKFLDFRSCDTEAKVRNILLIWSDIFPYEIQMPIFHENKPEITHITCIQQTPFLEQSLNISIEIKTTLFVWSGRLSFRSPCHLVPVIWLNWVRVAPSSVTVNDQRVSPDNGCACAIVNLPDMLGCLICMIGQMRPGYGNWFQTISMVWRNRWSVSSNQNSDL